MSTTRLRTEETNEIDDHDTGFSPLSPDITVIRAAGFDVAKMGLADR
jgi:hypothetical protein